MKNIALIVTLLYGVASLSFGQANQVSLKTVLTSLEGQHGVSFSYDDEVANRLTVDLQETGELQRALDAITEQTGLVFSEAGTNTYLIKMQSLPFCVRVLDEGGSPLDRAQIILDNKITNITTDIEGYARFDSRLTYQDTIKIYYFGYNTHRTAAQRLYGSTCPVVNMTFGQTTLKEVVITNYITSGIDFSQDDHSLKIRTSDLALLPGETDGDILLAIKTLPGITSPNGKAGNLHVRGSTTDHTLVLYDNIPIYHKGHYFGTISPYNPISVEEVTVHRSGYGPQLGGRVGGAIELKTKSGIPDSTLYSVGLNSYYGAVSAEVPINKRLGVSAHFRSSYPGNWQSPKLEALNELALQNSIISLAEENEDQTVLDNSFNFHDANVNINYKLKNGSLSATMLTIANLQEGAIDNTSRNSVLSLSNDLANTGINLDWNQYWNQNFNSSFSTTFSQYDYISLITSQSPDRPLIIPDQFEHTIKDYQVHAEGNMLFDTESNHQLTLGYQMNRQQIDDYAFSERPRQPVREMENRNVAYLHSVFTNHRIDINSKLSLNSGLRTNYHTLSEEIRIEPRLFLNWQASDKIALKSSYGLYSQYITQNVYFDFEDTKVENLVWELASKEKPVIKSEQAMVGAVWKAGGFLLDAELYHKRIHDLSVLKTGATNDMPSRFAIGDLQVYGIDALLSKKWGKLDTWVSYSYTYTEMDFPELNLLTFETYYDQPHTLNVNATMPFRNWNFSIGWQYQSGVPIYTNNTFFPVPGPNQPPQGAPTAQENEGRFPDQHQLDMAIVYHFPKIRKPWNGSIGLSLLNIYNKNNLVAENYLTFGATTTLEERYAIGFAPNVMITIRW